MKCACLVHFAPDDLLCVADPSPVVALNRAVAVGELDGATTALGWIDALTRQEPERRFLEQRLCNLGSPEVTPC